MDGFDGRGASAYDQEYDSDEELVELTETDSSGDEDMVTESEVSDEDITTEAEAEAEATRPTRNAREIQNILF